MIGAAPAEPGGDYFELALAPTLRAAACRGARGESVRLRPGDLHRTLRLRRQESLIVFLVDASDSMGEGAVTRMALAKGAVLALLRRAYLCRDRVALVTFRDQGAETRLAPTRSGTLAREKLRRLAIGGATPLAAGLHHCRDLIVRERRRDPGLQPLLVIISDGEANVPRERGRDLQREILEEARALMRDKIKVVLFDAGGNPQENLLPQMARVLGVSVQRLQREGLAQTVRLIEDGLSR